MITRLARSILWVSTAGWLATACVVDNGDRPDTAPEPDYSDPGSGPFDCTADDNFEFEMFDHFEFGAALGTWYANNEVCEGCQALTDSLKALYEKLGDLNAEKAEAEESDTEDVDTEDSEIDTESEVDTEMEALKTRLANLTEKLDVCRERCKASQFPTIFDKPLPADSIDGTRCGSNYAFHLTVTSGVLVDWGANWGTKLSPTFDGTEWDGLSFWARRAPDSRGTVRVELADKFTDGEYEDEDGNSYCTQNYTDDTTFEGCDRFGGYAAVGTDWEFFTIPFEDFRQAGWGVSAPYFDIAGLRTLTFLFPAGYWDIWIDDVAFYRQRSN